MRIEPHDLTGPEIAAFLEAHVTQMRAVSPPCSKHALDLEGLRASNLSFWVVRDEDGRIVGSGALKWLSSAAAELKSMRTEPNRLRSGIATRLLVHLLAEARGRQVNRVYLETGSNAFFEPARRLYEKHGFTPCPPFGDYREDPNSAYYVLAL